MWLFQVNINTILTLQSQSVSWSFFCHRLFLLFRNARKCSDTVNSLSHEAPFTQSHVSEIHSCVSVTHAILWWLFWIVFMNNQCFYSFLYWKSGLLPGFLFLLWIKLLCILLCKSFCEPVFSFPLVSPQDTSELIKNGHIFFKSGCTILHAH